MFIHIYIHIYIYTFTGIYIYMYTYVYKPQQTNHSYISYISRIIYIYVCNPPSVTKSRHWFLKIARCKVQGTMCKVQCNVM